MQSFPILSKTDLPTEAAPLGSSATRLLLQWVFVIAAAFVLGSWLVWLNASVQRSITMDDIRAACQRLMPDTVERCVDTVIIQRGGARR